jgi:hypothetical protein
MGIIESMTSMAVDRAIDRLAGSQYGVMSHAQALALGATDGVIKRRLGSGRWRRLAPGLYVLASHPESWHQHLMAAVLAEPRAVIGGRSAAALHALTGFAPGPIQVVVPRGSNHRSSLATVRECRDFRATSSRGIPVLTVCDTLFGVAAVAHRSRVALALDDALSSGLVGVGELQERYEELRHGRRRGMATMRHLIAARRVDGFVPATSVLEGLLYGILDGPGMPPYRRQARVPWSPDRRVDAMLVGAPVIIEADGRRWHTRVADFDRDRQRDREAALHGYRTLRYTFGDLSGDGGRVRSEVRAAARVAA